ncbi:HVO_0649 family zinc finger protein [Halorussus pelagicus]|uniref:HVO_0649 family zinc finger protein n=1 Tax=Halorussus pelagicus TaxID=2505977 RepID=UPI000FFB8E53|nr:HVO_0649 family zinc finger protein [Halorussus pelagicus]
MANNNPGGLSPFERLRSRFEDEDLVCPKCGYDDEDGKWLAETGGDRIQYRHLCPSCGYVRRRTFRLGAE